MAQYVQTDVTNIAAPPPAKKVHQDPFSSLRSLPSSPAVTTENLTTKLAGELDEYLASSISNAPNNPLMFWRMKATDYPRLSQVARKVYVIQASSGESERHFSSGGAIVSSKRSSMDPSTVECLVVLKEASLNRLW